jgi:hypothetical protein
MAINPAFANVLSADAETRRGLFAATARRLGTSERNVEKDFWVCLTLDVLFNGLEPGGPRLLFKGEVGGGVCNIGGQEAIGPKSP